MRTLLGLMLASLFLLSASCQHNPFYSSESPVPVIEYTSTPQSDPDIVEYAVYNDLLEARFKGDEIEQVLIIDHSRVGNNKLLERTLAEFQEDVPLAPEMVSSFMERNQQSFPIKPVLDFGVKYQLLS